VGREGNKCNSVSAIATELLIIIHTSAIMDLLQKRLPRQISYVLGEEESGEGGGEGGGKTNRKKWKTQKYKHPKNRKHKKTGKPTEEEEEEEEDCSSTACNKPKLALP
jgi:hypothetical protein